MYTRPIRSYFNDWLTSWVNWISIKNNDSIFFFYFGRIGTIYWKRKNDIGQQIPHPSNHSSPIHELSINELSIHELAIHASPVHLWPCPQSRLHSSITHSSTIRYTSKKHHFLRCDLHTQPQPTTTTNLHSLHPHTLLV